MYGVEAGRQFEKYIHETVLKKTKYEILSEKEIKCKYGHNNSAIDHFIELDDFCLCIQDKYEQTCPHIQKINHFIACVTNVSQICKKRCISIYLSRLPLTGPSNLAFINQNTNTMNKYYSINNNDKEELIKNLILFLYEIGIYRYEEDDSCIMLEN